MTTFQTLNLIVAAFRCAERSTPANLRRAILEAVPIVEAGESKTDLNWNYITEDPDLPDDEIRVWVAADDEIYEAYHEDDQWLCAESGNRLSGVYAWAHIPEAPPRLKRS